MSATVGHAGMHFIVGVQILWETFQTSHSVQPQHYLEVRSDRNTWAYCDTAAASESVPTSRIDSLIREVSPFFGSLMNIPGESAIMNIGCRWT